MEPFSSLVPTLPVLGLGRRRGTEPAPPTPTCPVLELALVSMSALAILPPSATDLPTGIVLAPVRILVMVRALGTGGTSTISDLSVPPSKVSSSKSDVSITTVLSSSSLSL